MIVLWHRYRDVDGVFPWLDWATRQHVHRRQVHAQYGPFTGGHFDGSTGRTLVMHMMLASQGVRCQAFAEELCLGGVVSDGSLHLTIESGRPWNGKLIFDGPRSEYPTARLDWARLNEMPQWFVARPGRKYLVTVDQETPRRMDGAELIDGLEVGCHPSVAKRILVQPHDKAVK